MNEDRSGTKDRLLDAAEDLFLHHGYEKVSIRELALAADVNIAAINYHFQGKDNLYREVIKRRFTVQRDRILLALEEVTTRHGGSPPLEDVIRSMVQGQLSDALSDIPAGNLFKLIVREVHTESRHSTALFLREMVAPVFRAFSDAMIQARPNLTQEQVDWIVASIIGQVHHFIGRWQKSRVLFDSSDDSVEVMLEAFPVLRQPVEQYVQQTTDHITQFSAAAIDALYPEVTS